MELSGLGFFCVGFIVQHLLVVPVPRATINDRAVKLQANFRFHWLFVWIHIGHAVG